MQFKFYLPLFTRRPTAQKCCIDESHKQSVRTSFNNFLNLTFIRWRFIKDLNEDLTPKFMEKIRENVRTSFYARHVYSYKLRNIEDGTVIIYYTNHGSPWMNTLAEAEKWLSEKETKRLDSENINRPPTKWEFVGYFNADLKVVVDRQPLLGT